MKVFAKSDIGLTRQVNEDSFCVLQNNHDDWMAVVCDGIGGAAAGEVASQIAIDTLREAFLKAPEFLKDSQVNEWIQEQLHQANDAIYQQSMIASEQKGMGTTCVGCIISKRRTYIFNVGDSRIYALYDDGLIQMSEDHSVIAQMIKEGKITPEQAKNHVKRNTLTNALGIWHVFRIDINKIQSNYKALLLCSDGLHGYVEEAEILKVIESSVYQIDEKVNDLIARANQVGGYDNCTIILMENEEVSHD